MPLTSPELATPADHAACRALLRDGSRTFLAASRLLPEPVRDPAIALYAFCRVADDAIDTDPAIGAATGLAKLQERLRHAYAGTPLDLPADRALADVVARFAIPRALPEALLEGFAWDAAGRRYATIDDTIAYAVRVAGSVGAMTAMLMGARDAAIVGRACDLGIAMQLSNIARDVGEDARAGRLYLPADWLSEAGIDPDAFLHSPRFTAGLGSVVQRLLHSADALYARAEPAIARLPLSCRPGISAARWLYAEIGREVERRGFNSISTRAVVSPLRKTRLMLHSLAAIGRPMPWQSLAPLPQTNFLLAAVAAAAPPARPRRSLEDRVAWTLNLFERLERRQLGETAVETPA